MITPEQYLTRVGWVTKVIDGLTAEPVEWDSVDEQMDAWDQLERLQGDLAVIVRQHAVELGKKTPKDYLHPRAGLVHTERERSTEWDGAGVLDALSEPMTVTGGTGEVIDAIPTDVLREVLPAVKEGKKSSKWNITGLLAAGVQPDPYRRTRFGDKLLRRGPSYTGKGAAPKPASGSTLEEVPLLSAEDSP